MVEYSVGLDRLFYAFSDATRRDVLQRLIAVPEMAIGELASFYQLTLAGLSKHLKVLETASLVVNQKRGRVHYVRLNVATVRQVADYLSLYEHLWSDRLDNLDRFLQEELSEEHKEVLDEH